MFFLTEDDYRQTLLAAANHTIGYLQALGDTAAPTLVVEKAWSEWLTFTSYHRCRGPAPAVDALWNEYTESIISGFLSKPDTASLRVGRVLEAFMKRQADRWRRRRNGEHVPCGEGFFAEEPEECVQRKKDGGD